eukprot:Plantae.Rhodophyta-Palmaria_palmata.ctg191.p1 GENE.Plantae.Rhodophyta-Palmaria_palmata.ctg191~~Plantae.Rhodophyta-Palmaria_palmata.ctg191.p1  ORF type:complete len:271 (+),score=12.51 Plantae.Rhodophyta-Palmaria_palmata.ctg191:810-1622(+)
MATIRSGWPRKVDNGRLCVHASVCISIHAWHRVLLTAARLFSGWYTMFLATCVAKALRRTWSTLINLGTEDEKMHIVEVGKLFDRLLESGMRVKFSKCLFGKREVTSLGHTIKHNAIRPSDEHVDAIPEQREPTDGNGLCRFIGVANYFRQHIPDLSNKLLPLFEVLSGSSWNQKKYKRQPVRIEDWDRKWGEAQRAAWEDVKAAPMNPNILAAPRHGAKKRLEMDASDAAIGGALLLELALREEEHRVRAASSLRELRCRIQQCNLIVT